MISFREAEPSDAAAIGALHVACWREAYSSLLSQELLNDLSADARSEMWRTVLQDPAAFYGTAVFVVDNGGELVAFGSCGGQRDGALREQGFDGEIGAIYVLKAHQGAGIGRSLMRLLGARLVEQDRTAASLWVLRENGPARAFYERLGGRIIGERQEEQSGATLIEVAYGWRDLEALSR